MANQAAIDMTPERAHALDLFFKSTPAAVNGTHSIVQEFNLARYML
jgi:hypothetical protein